MTHFGSNKFSSCLGGAEIELALKQIWAAKLSLSQLHLISWGVYQQNELNWARLFKFWAIMNWNRLYILVCTLINSIYFVKHKKINIFFGIILTFKTKYYLNHLELVDEMNLLCKACNQLRRVFYHVQKSNVAQISYLSFFHFLLFAVPFVHYVSFSFWKVNFKVYIRKWLCQCTLILYWPIWSLSKHMGIPH